MKRTLLLATALMATLGMTAASDVASTVFPAEAVSSISPNGEWMVSELDVERSMLIRHIPTGKQWTYIYDGMDNGVDYLPACTQSVSDSGIVIGEVHGVPSYWIDGVWTSLPGSQGLIAAMLGGITPDGSAIVGSLGTRTSMRTSPCIWYRNDDGTYGNPVFLPSTLRDIFGGGGQYVNATSVSDDAKTVGISMVSGNGFFHTVCLYQQDDNGEWSATQLGYDLVNPTGTIVRSPGDYRGPSWPNFEEYMTQQQLDEMFAASEIWSAEKAAEGYTDEEISIMSLSFVMDFMSEDKRTAYQRVLDAFLKAYLPWRESYSEYEAFLARMIDEGMDFLFNNVFVSHDGKFTFATGYRTVVEDPLNPENGVVMFHAPVRFDNATGEPTVYSYEPDVLVSGVTNDYSVVGWAYNRDIYWPRQAYIFPQNSTEAVSIPDYMKEKGKENAFNWLEEMLYQEVIVSMNSSGQYQYDDAWCCGKPIPSADLGIIGFAVSTLYWTNLPEESAIFMTYLLNPDNAGTSGVESLESDSQLSVKVLPGGCLEVGDSVTDINIYDVSGKLVFASGRTGKVISTGISSGIYIVKASTASGDSYSVKAAF